MANSGDIRIGFVSSYDAANGTASVYYPDRANEVTTQLPVFAPCGCAQTLNKDDMVLVAHLSNGGVAGMVIGAAMKSSAAGLRADGGTLTLFDSSGSVTVQDIITRLGG
ncbi:MAG: hypothetical protein J5947_03840 [Clostridium sp.]|nr:hypothetical protein [Clostridium sp.]